MTTPTKRKRTVKEPTPMTLGHKGASLFVDKTVEIDNSIVISDGKNKFDVTFSNNNYLASIDLSHLDSFYNTIKVPNVDVDKLIIKYIYVEEYGYLGIDQNDLKNIFQYVLTEFVVCNKQLVKECENIDMVDKLYSLLIRGIDSNLLQNFSLIHNTKLPDRYLLDPYSDKQNMSEIKKASDKLNDDIVDTCIYVINLINYYFLTTDKKNISPKLQTETNTTKEEETK